MIDSDLIVNNLLSEISTKIEWESNNVYLNWLKTEIGLDDETIKYLMDKKCLPLPYSEYQHYRE